MRVMWLCNIIIPVIAESMSVKGSNSGGWLTGLYNDLQKCDGIELAVCFPYNNGTKIIKGQVAGFKYYGFPKKLLDPSKYEIDVEGYLKEILNDFKPDILHIFGTEFPHTLSAAKVFGLSDKTVISIQGLVSIYSTHYYANLPQRIVNRYTFRDYLKNDNIRKQALKFKCRGKFEIAAIRAVKHVIGRTDWDRACCMQINDNLNYHYCNETLRDSFYSHEWDIERCEENSIFVSQCSYPIKGFHFMIEAMPIILEQFPNAHIYTTGYNPLEKTALKDRLRFSSYQLYLKEIIQKYRLQDKITFMGELDEKLMCERFIKSHVFVLPSSIENSPNSLGEAMLLGVPTVASDVGGVKNMLTHNTDGFVYQYDAPYMLAYYICRIFNDRELAMYFSANSKLSARKTHSREVNIDTLLGIYNEIKSHKINEGSVIL